MNQKHVYDMLPIGFEALDYSQHLCKKLETPQPPSTSQALLLQILGYGNFVTTLFEYPPSHCRNVAFGAGKRSCVGENLARNRAFLFLACLMQKYTITPAEGYPLPPRDPREYAPGLSIRPKSYFISAELCKQ